MLLGHNTRRGLLATVTPRPPLIDRMPAETMVTMSRRMLDLDKPLYTISVAAEILASHPRTLTRQSGLNIAGGRYVIKCLQLLDAHGSRDRRS